MNFIDQALHTEEGRSALARAMTEPLRLNVVDPIHSEELSKSDVWSDDAYAYDWEKR